MKKLVLIFYFLIGLTACDDITEVDNITDQTITILAPTNESVLNSANLSFSWEALEGVENYRLQIATPNFENAAQIVEDTLITRANFNKTLDASNYEWRIKGVNAEHETAYTINGFTIIE